MRHLRSSILRLGLFFIALSTPFFAYAQDSSLFGPIVPQAGEVCACPGSAPDWGCILQIVQGAINIGIALAIVGVVLVIAYAGFTFMLSSTNPEARNRGKTMIANAVIGLVVVLGAWLFVDFIMKAFVNTEATFAGKNLGPWNEILAPTGEDMCIEINVDASKALTSGSAELRTSIIMNAVANNTLVAGSGVCNPEFVKAEAAKGGVTMSQIEAAQIACIAGPESTCGSNAGKNYNWNAAKSTPPSTAYGPFQITLKGNARYFENQACYKAAGVTGNLNCAAAFDRGGYAIEGPVLQRCMRAAANVSCSASAATALYRDEGIKPWTGNYDTSAAARGCAVKK